MRAPNKHPAFLLLAILLLTSACWQRDKASIFYHQVNAIYGLKNNAVAHYLSVPSASTQSFAVSLHKYISAVDELPPFPPGDSLKSIVREELMLLDSLARKDSTAPDSLAKAAIKTAISNSSLPERIYAANRRFADSFRLPPLNLPDR